MNIRKLNEELDRLLNEEIEEITEPLLKENINTSYKVQDREDSNRIYYDGTGYVVEIFEFMQGDNPMYSELTRFKELSDAKYAAKIINRNRSNYEDCIRLIPNYDEKQI